MGLKIRLARAGAKKRPYYHIVVADSRSPRALVPWKSSANNSEMTPLFVHTPSAHLRSMSTMNFAVLSSGVAQWLCWAWTAAVRATVHIS